MTSGAGVLRARRGGIRPGQRPPPASGNAVIGAILTQSSTDDPHEDATSINPTLPEDPGSTSERSSAACYLTEAVARAARDKRGLAVCCLHFERLRLISDSYGREVGEQLLQEAERRVRFAAGKEGLGARLYGTERILILENVPDGHPLDTTASRILAAITEPFDIDGRFLATPAYMGLSLFPRDGASVCKLMRQASAALHYAKEPGHDHCQVFRPAIRRQITRTTRVESRLRSALRQNEMDVFYQPIVDTRTLRVAALEALLRWKQPAGGWLAAKDFIEIAERTGLILAIGALVLERVLRDVARWRDAGCTLVPVAVNVSALQLQRGDLYDVVIQGIRSLDLDPALLQLELTESAMFDPREGCDSGRPRESSLARLRRFGVHIAIDDFGTGYSSLSYLKRWRVDSLKIPRQFVRQVATDPHDAAIVSAICTMAQSLDIAVVAEGIENRQQLRKVRELGCCLGQGYLFSKAVSAQECQAYLASARSPVIPATGAESRVNHA